MLYDYAVIGLGPTGAVLANLLGQSGKRILVLERDPLPYDKPRAIGIDQESMRILQFCGIAHDFSCGTFPFRGTKYIGVNGETIKAIEPVPRPYLLGWPPNASFLQPQLEALLREKLTKYDNVHIHLSHQLNTIKQEADYCTLTAENLTDNSEVDFSSRYIIGCDGAKSVVRSHLSVEMEDLAFDEQWLVIDAIVQDTSKTPPSGRHYCWPSRPASYILGPGKLRRWELKLLPHETPEDFQDDAQVFGALASYVDVSKVEIWRRAVYRFHALVSGGWRKGCVFIAGDAAHQTPPFMGQGMNSGFRDAANIAWKLILSEFCDSAPYFLNTYEIERRPHFRSLVQTAKELGLIIGELDMEAAKARDIHLMSAENDNKRTLTRQSLIPNLTTGLISVDSQSKPILPAGQLFPQPNVRMLNGKSGLLDDFLGMNFLLVTCEVANQAWLDDTERDFWKQIRGNQVVITGESSSDFPERPGLFHFLEQDHVFRDWMTQHDSVAVIVRPDRYVYGAAKDKATLHSLLSDLRGTIFGNGCAQE